ncbi:hypothetical protein ABZ667_43335 [Streptomyces lavendulae]|uniref:hypothetical protein n=1 Tax=Streptomyces lavendulae TaxID=1914 RepID=UPI0034002612
MKLLEGPAVVLRTDRAADHPRVVSDAAGIRYKGGRRRDQADLDVGVPSPGATVVRPSVRLGLDAPSAAGEVASCS